MAVVRSLLFPLFLTMGCYSSDAFDAFGALADDNTTGSTSTPKNDGDQTASATAGTESGGGTAETSTGAEPTSGSTDPSDTDSATGGVSDGETTAGVEGPSVSLTVVPSVLALAGPVEITVEHSSDAVRFELWDDADDLNFQSEWLKGDDPPPYLLTQGAPGELRSLTVRAYDSDGNVGVSTPATVELQLPASGTVLWETEVALDDHTQARAITSGMYTNSVAIFPGYDAGQAARVSRVNPEGQVNLNAPVAEPLSTTTGVALTPDGVVLAVGVDLVGGKNVGWVARVNPADADVKRIWAGKPGESFTGLAYAHAKKRIYVSGYAPQGSSAPDARVWAISIEGDDLLWTQGWERPASAKDKGLAFDRAMAVALLENGDVALVGESWLLPNGKKVPEEWAFVLRYSPSGALTEGMSWTSGDSIERAGALAVAADVDNGILVAGWSSPVTGSRQATVWAFDELLQGAELYSQGPSDTWTSKAVARLKTGEIINIVDVDSEERHDFEVRALESGFVTKWTRVFTGGTETRGAALTITPHGHIIVAGTRLEANNTSTMLLIGLHS